MKRCAWISRHVPTHEQRIALKAYRIYQINPPGRLWSAADAIVLSQNACGGWPDLFVVVMPVIMLQHFVNQVNGHVPIVRGIFTKIGTPEWTGKWEEIKAIHIVTQDWTPNRKELT